MKRSLLLLALAVLAVGASSTAQDRERTSDGAHRVAYAIDPITGEYLFAEDIDPLFFNTSETFPAATSAPSANTIQMNQVATMDTPSFIIVSNPTGFDLDHDTHREFIMRKATAPASTTIFEFYESVSNNRFELAHVLNILPPAVFRPSDVGDADNDGLAELTVFGRIGAEFFVRLYESTSTTSYPTELVWEVDAGISYDVGAKIADTDGDDIQEIVVAGFGVSEVRLVIYENEGDNSFGQTFYRALPELDHVQSMEVADDLDGDGRVEILVGGLIEGRGVGSKVFAFESTGNDVYEQIWASELLPGGVISVEQIVYAGDLDNDGKKEFLAGGLKAISQPGEPFFVVFKLFEATSDNDFQVVATFSQPYGTLESQSTANIADVDGDGFREIVIGSGTTVRIFRNIGDNAWEEIWSTGAGNLFSIGAGDHDADGKEEIILQDGFGVNDFTGIWEIDPADAADVDADGVVDAIDNCPLTANHGQEDADSDTVGNVCDNCIYGPNSAQGPAIFGQDVVAKNSQTFSWPVAADVVFVKGNLANVSTYTVDLVDSVALTNDLTDAAVPATGTGFYYLVRPDCLLGSWQTSLGAEPERDLALP